jgi:D-tyrosyl-tRNA(Tyr) deacylase
MRALVQRVAHAQVEVAGQTTGRIDQGLLVFLGVRAEDGEREIDWLTKKLPKLRIFGDEEGKMNRSVADIGGGMLVVSQFTLYGNCKKGNRPSYIEAAPPEQAEALYEQFVQRLREQFNGPVATGQFGGDMKVGLLNDGPVTLWLDTEALLS